MCCGKRAKALLEVILPRDENHSKLTGEAGCAVELMAHLLSKVDVVTHLHIRDSIFWVAVKLHCAQTGGNESEAFAF